MISGKNEQITSTSMMNGITPLRWNIMSEPMNDPVLSVASSCDKAVSTLRILLAHQYLDGRRDAFGQANPSYKPHCASPLLFAHRTSSGINIRLSCKNPVKEIYYSVLKNSLTFALIHPSMSCNRNMRERR
jgi:hypothetical protein